MAFQELPCFTSLSLLQILADGRVGIHGKEFVASICHPHIVVDIIEVIYQSCILACRLRDIAGMISDFGEIFGVKKEPATGTRKSDKKVGIEAKQIICERHRLEDVCAYH